MSITVLYYTANRIAPHFAAAVRAHLRDVSAEGLPVISISHEPIAFGEENIVVGKIRPSTYHVYRQILIGARAATTEFVACAEDDCLYVRAHFDERPTAGGFLYNKNRWWVEPSSRFRWRDRTGMHTCIVSRELLIETLETRFDRIPEPASESEARAAGWGEPGRYEHVLKLPRVGLEYRHGPGPVLTFNHRPSLGGLRKGQETDILERSLAPWGKARDVWKRFVDGTC